LSEVGFIEINNLSETLLIKAKCMYIKLKSKLNELKNPPVHW